jgi:prolyl-tRNA synthetase
MDKKKNFSEWYTEMLKNAELIDQRYDVKGFLVHRPNATITEKLMYKAFEKELERRNHKPTMFPSVIPEENFEKEKEHAAGFEPGVFWVTHGAKTPLEQKIALRPTSETVMYKMYSMWIRSWRDLPLKIYQSCQVWRYETKATRPLLRDREFYWIEAHNVFATQEEAEKQVLEDMDITEKVMHQRFGIPFLFFKRPEWDKFSGAVYSFGADSLMPDGCAIQQPATHFLGQNFAKAFDVKFADEKEQEQYAWQTCYGPAISRIYASLISIHGDEKGVVLPFDLAPTQVVIVPVYSKDNKKEIDEKSTKILEKLKEMNVRAVFDDSEKQPGAKYYFWEERGAAVRIEIGASELSEKSLTAVRRDLGKREKIPETEIENYLKKAKEEMLQNLKRKADEEFEKHIHEAKSWEELKQKLELGGFVRINFCSRDADGKNCAEILKAETKGGEVRGTLLGKEEKPDGNCFVCGKPAGVVVYVARAY